MGTSPPTEHNDSTSARAHTGHGPELIRGDRSADSLHALLREHLGTFLARFEDEHGGRRLPSYVIDELRAAIRCGDPRFGVCRIHCPSCDGDLLVPFSCKGRGFCPAYGGRRMAEAAAHLTDRVIPFVPVRQWVLSVPWPLRFAMARDKKLCRAIARAFLRAVSSAYVRKARRDPSIASSTPEPPGSGPLGSLRIQTGAINFVQRFGSSLALNIHFHALFLDGLHVTTGVHGNTEFIPAPPLEPVEVQRVHRDIARRITRVLRSFGLSEDSPPPDDMDASESRLPFVQAASIQSKVALGEHSGQPIPRLIDAPSSGDRSWAAPPNRPRLVYDADGFSLHAATRVEAANRDRLESLIRYVARPALSLGRLEVEDDGKVKWSLKRPWKDGTRAFVFDPHSFLERLVALIPHPREHRWTYFGSLAPAASIRDLVAHRAESAQADAHSSRIPWAELLQRTFGVDVLRCPRCGGRRHWIAAISRGDALNRILRHAGIDPEPEPLLPARPPPEPWLPF